MSEQDLRLELEALRKEVAELREAVAALKATPAPAAPKPAPAAAPAPKAEAISPEVMMVISAAVAAYLGKRATIKLVRPMHRSMDGWRLQGRVAIQGSHRVR